MKKIKFYTAVILGLICSAAICQEAGKVIHQAMEEEIARNMKGLHLEGMKDPFLIGLDIVDFNMISIHSSLGAIIRVSESPARVTFNNMVLVGDYDNNNLNYSDPRSMPYFYRTYGGFVLDNSLSEIKRDLWIYFDRAYKYSTEIFESKQSALKSKTQSEDIAGLPDYTRSEKVIVEKPEISLKFNSETLIRYANDVSLSLKSYKFLTASWVKIVGYKANIYYSNSEGSRATYPCSVIRMVVQTESQAPTGEWLELYRVYHFLNEGQMPSKEQVIKDAQVNAETLAELQKAPVFNDVYNGPVMFEDQAASEAVRKSMFFMRNENLFSARKTVVGGPAGAQPSQNTISNENRIDKRVSIDGFSVKAKPLMTEYDNIPLIGSYPVDMEGVVPPGETILIENGILRNLLCGRTPTAKMKASNGHFRVPMTSPSPMVVPGVIEVDYSNAVSKDSLKKKLIALAKDEGLDYALIVREMTSNQSALHKVYKIDVNTGKEQLVRSAAFSGLTLNDLRKLAGTSNKKRVMNTTAGEDLQPRYDYLNGCPATFISPDALLFKDIQVIKSTRQVMNKLPAVKSPLAL